MSPGRGKKGPGEQGREGTHGEVRDEPAGEVRAGGGDLAQEKNQGSIGKVIE